MLAGLVLIIAAIFYRVLYALAGAPADWANFSPLAAIVLCAGAYLRPRAAFLMPLGIVFISDLILNAHYHVPLLDARMLPGYFSFGLILLLGFWISRQQHHKMLYTVAGSIVASMLFYLITNTADWWFDAPWPLPVPPYPRTAAGLYQALTTGHPGFPPTILFFRNTLISDFSFTILFLLSWALSSLMKRAVPDPSAVPKNTNFPETSN
jgi:hypothetical protein